MEKPLTHYVPFYNRPDEQGQALTICGLMVPELDSTALPSCDKCEAYFTIITRGVCADIAKELKS